MEFRFKTVIILMLMFIPQAARADMGFIDRLLYSDKPYASEIEVKAYIITPEQACAVFRDPPQEPIQLDNQGLRKASTYLFIQVKNNGKKRAWGTLACKAPLYHVPIKISILHLDDSQIWNNYLIHLGSLMILETETGYPKFSVEWDELYAK